MSNLHGANSRRGIGRIGQNIADELNELSPGLGTRLTREINQQLAVLSTRIDAQAGHRGTVVIAKQTGKDAKNRPAPAILVDGDRVGGNAADPIDDGDFVTLRYFRRFFDCDWFEQQIDDCVELPEATVTPGTERCL